nr:hypothetical protein CFP56_46439 [Quercus suber]
MLNQGLMEHHKEIAKYFNRKGVSAIFLFLKNLLHRMVPVTIAKALEYFNSTGHIILYHEDLIMNLTTLKDLQEFLKLPQMVLTSRQIKICKGPLSNHFKNWEDNKTLTATAYESFIHAESFGCSTAMEF